MADVKSAADAFLQAATQAPQPMHAAESIACSTVSFEIRMALRVLRAADVDRRVAAGLDDPVERAAIDDEILDEREGLARATARAMSVSPSLNRRMCSWHTVVPRIRPVRDAVDQEAAGAADALAAVRVERDRVLALRDQRLR